MVSQDLQWALVASYTNEEIKASLWQMGSWMVPGLDGFHAGLFKRTWEVMGSAMCKFVHGILNGDEIPPESAKALLVLVSKVSKPITIENFKLIAL